MLPYATNGNTEKIASAIADEKVKDIKLKTINGQDLHGEGNIEVTGGGDAPFELNIENYCSNLQNLGLFLQGWMSDNVMHGALKLDSIPEIDSSVLNLKVVGPNLLQSGAFLMLSLRSITSWGKNYSGDYNWVTGSDCGKIISGVITLEVRNTFNDCVLSFLKDSWSSQEQE